MQFAFVRLVGVLDDLRSYFVAKTYFASNCIMWYCLHTYL